MKRQSPIELRQIRYFVTLAELLSFRKAAERLFITQPSLSHQIALLEAALGVRLFERDRRRVVLTEAGNALLGDARRLLAESDTILTKARRLGAPNPAAVRVGFPEFANRTLIPDIIDAFRTRKPHRLSLVEGYSRTLLPELRHGRLDVAFMSVPPAEDASDLEFELIVDELAGLVLAASHRLASQSEIPVSALAGEQLLLADRPVNPMLYDQIARWLEQAGVQPRFYKVNGTGAYTFDTALSLVQSGEAISFATASMAAHLPDGVVWRPVAGTPLPFRIGAFWSPTNTSPLVGEFLDLAREVRDKRLSPAIS